MNPELTAKVGEALEATRRAIVAEYERVDWTPLAAAMDRVREAAGVAVRGSRP